MSIRSCKVVTIIKKPKIQNDIQVTTAQNQDGPFQMAPIAVAGILGPDLVLLRILEPIIKGTCILKYPIRRPSTSSDAAFPQGQTKGVKNCS